MQEHNPDHKSKSATSAGKRDLPATNRSPTTTEHELAEDDLYAALDNSRRRQIIRALADQPEFELSALATRIAAIENECAPQELGAQQKKRVYIALHQSHIKKLHKWGIVEWDSRNHIANCVARGPTYAVALEAMRRVSGQPEPESVLDRVRSLVPGVA